ncbi:MAG TPA: SDR family NAD(P)-dependent oxidoreductase [Proteiniclasticum sp.]|nr:SDR family NAD(P)-dependent oxidoreductase [Proteiniclasticum sp.]
MKKKSKTAIITGANSGMGKASARMLAEKGYEVLMLVRDQKRGEEEYGNQTCTMYYNYIVVNVSNKRC